MSHPETPTHPSLPPDLPQRAVDLAETLLRTAKEQQSSAEREQSERLARMMGDPAGKELTIAMVDQAFRSHQPARIADQISHLLDQYGTPRYMDWWERAALTLGGVMGHYLPGVVIPPVIARLRQETRTVILPGEETDLRKYLARRRQDGTRLNLNQLGEAILGEEEARRRMEAYLALLARPDVEYISVKVSSVFSQINLVAYRHTVELVKERLRTLYRQALAHTYTHPDGSTTPKFVNLDMEEYRDLHLTVDAFTEVLDEAEFMTLPAGIVLQGYIPDSHPIQISLTEWAMKRVARGGAAIKIRIVKGANLAMERVEAALHDWPQAPYYEKVEVDANFKRMVAYGCHPERAKAARLGVASHNLFDIALALLLREEAGVQEFVEFEMLEGMANHQARAVQAQAGGLLLYAPVVKSEDFHSAIAYLVRRLDENTAPENFLHDIFGMEPGSPEWVKQRDQFLAACARVSTAKASPNRTQNRLHETPSPAGAAFHNEADTDWSLPANQRWVAQMVEEWQHKAIDPLPLQINGEFVTGKQVAHGVDSSNPGQPRFDYTQADAAQVEQAIAAAVTAQPAWAARAVDERRAILEAAADEFARIRGDLMAAMMLEAGKTPSEADPEISEGIDFARYYAQGFEVGGLAEMTGDCNFAPFGVVTVTPPWNFPFAIPAGGVMAALMAGNAVLFKPAPEATLVGWLTANALWAAGVPKQILQFVPAPDNEIGQRLIADERIGGVILTGSIETARLFQGWRPHLRLFAETSGKDALIVTALADRDQAIKDLVKSAFGHNGQKCSAASLAILEAEVYDDPAFRRQLRDAAESRAVGSAWDLSALQTPLTQPPSPKLYRALTTLDPGEEWLLEPKPIGSDAPHPGHRLWSPGIKLGVRPGSFFHKTECFGPVLGLMRAEDLDHAIELANAVEFGLTGGIHSLDDREVDVWKERIEVGNAYVNRAITGAIVQRQPFGGWKASNVGPGAKAGGPNYVIQFGEWQQRDLPSQQSRPAPVIAGLLSRLQTLVPAAKAELLHAAAGSYAYAIEGYFSQEHDPSQILGELNILRYVPLDQLVLRATPESDPTALALALLAAATCQTPTLLSLAPGMDGWYWLDRSENMTLITEDEATLIARLQARRAEEIGWPRLRSLGPLSPDLRRALNQAGVSVVDQPVLANGRLELRYYLREQAISQTVHRYGNVMGIS